MLDDFYAEYICILISWFWHWAVGSSIIILTCFIQCFINICNLFSFCLTASRPKFKIFSDCSPGAPLRWMTEDTTRVARVSGVTVVLAVPFLLMTERLLLWSLTLKVRIILVLIQLASEEPGPGQWSIPCPDSTVQSCNFKISTDKWQKHIRPN